MIAMKNLKSKDAPREVKCSACGGTGSQTVSQPAQPGRKIYSAALQAVPRQGPNKAGLTNDKPRHPGDTPATPTRPAYPLADVNDASDTSNA
jgi:hypothetical protein